MPAKTSVYRRLIAGTGGALLILASFLPWAGVQGVSRTGWELNTVADVLFLTVGVFGIATAITGGQFGVFRPDVSLIGATDILSVTATVLLAWLVLADFPEHATRLPGVFVALISAAATAFAVADYRPFRGAPMFSPITTSEPTRASIQQ
jgi:predicted membrane channel-forming protein YqfA (hemolysin III family)